MTFSVAIQKTVPRRGHLAESSSLNQILQYILFYINIIYNSKNLLTLPSNVE